MSLNDDQDKKKVHQDKKIVHFFNMSEVLTIELTLISAL